MTPYKTEVFNMTLPGEGPATIPITHDFDGAIDTLDIDLTQLINDGIVSFISGVQIDTLDGSTGSVILENPTSGQRVKFAAGEILLWPLLAPNPPKFTLTAVDGYNGNVRLHFVNFPLFPSNPITSASGGGAVTGPTLTNTAFGLSGASEELVAAGAALNYLLIQNPTGNSDLLVNLAGGDADATAFTITAGNSIELTKGLTNAVNVSGGGLETIIVAYG